MYLDEMPGFRRRFRIAPQVKCVHAAVEDDYHCMTVTLYHEDGQVTAVAAEMIRAPWTTCPGAEAAIRQALVGAALRDIARRDDKPQHCTHLFDLAVLGAAHADGSAVLNYEILIADPVEGEREAEIRRNGATLLKWREDNFRLTAPAELAGTRLDRMGDWIASLDEDVQEAARLLRWGNFLAHGRSIPMAQQSDATRMPPNCYTFQPQRKGQARRVGEILDFSAMPAQPLEDARFAFREAIHTIDATNSRRWQWK